ncbi:hypothetical protein MMC17_001170 [Xylographa soralifera]|nr:hypothetical protein [Xylographa soralifera]
MAGLKRSSTADGGRSKSTAKTKKGRSNEKVSALSSEYVVDSDSDAPADSAASVAKARNTPSKPDPVLSQPSLTRSPSKPAPKSTLPPKRKSPDSSEAPPTANKKAKTSDVEKQQVNRLEASKRSSTNTVPTESRDSPSNHREKKASGSTTSGSTKPNSTTNGTSKPKTAAKDNSETRAPAVSVHQNGAHHDSSSDDEESEVERGSTKKLTNQLAALKNGAGVPTSRKPLNPPALAPKALSQPGKQQDSKAPSNSSTSDDSDSEIEGSESESESESESSQSQKKTNPKVPPPTKPSAAPIPKYKPPLGFSPASNTPTPSSTSDVTKLFSQTNLASKQIWHFTLPASVPMSAIKSVPMDSILKGASAFTYENTDYAFISDPSSKHATAHLLIPTKEGSEYKAAPRSIARTLHLQQVLRLPDLSTAKAKDTDASQSSQGLDGVHNSSRSTTTTMLPPQKPLHEQPKGLRMRYMPFGDESNDSTNPGLDSDDEGFTALESASPTGFRMPANYAAALPQETHRLDDAGSPQAERRESPVKKQKKHRKDKEGSSQVPAASQSSIAKSSSQVNGLEDRPAEEAATNGVSHKHEGETAEEKAKRRAERERRKQERRRGRAEREGASSQVAATQ